MQQQIGYNASQKSPHLGVNTSVQCAMGSLGPKRVDFQHLRTKIHILPVYGITGLVSSRHTAGRCVSFAAILRFTIFELTTSGCTVVPLRVPLAS